MKKNKSYPQQDTECTNTTTHTAPKPFIPNDFFTRKYFNERYTFADSVRLVLLLCCVTVLSSNILKDSDSKTQARLLDVIPVEKPVSEQAVSEQIVVINPIPDEMLPAKGKNAQKKEPKLAIVQKEQAQKQPKAPQPKPATHRATTYKAPTTQPITSTYISNNKVSTPNNSAKTAHLWEHTLARAKQQGKQSFVLFGASYCMPCRMMKDMMRDHHHVKSYIDAHFLHSYIDIQTVSGKALRQKYAVRSLPTLIVFDQWGNQIARYEEALSSQKLLHALGKSTTNTTTSSNIVATTLPPAESDTLLAAPTKQENRKHIVGDIIADVQQRYFVPKGEK